MDSGNTGVNPVGIVSILVTAIKNTRAETEIGLMTLPVVGGVYGMTLSLKSQERK